MAVNEITITDGLYPELKELYEILSLKRGKDTRGEYELIRKFIKPLEGVQRDAYGNYYLRIGTAPILWSCHTDTVHKLDPHTQYQKLLVSGENHYIMAENSDCLGADNGVGVWIMLQLIKAGKEGLYIFHRAEEVGGLGSRYIARETPELLAGINYAVAFDRRANTSVITHQGTRTCSDQFAQELCDLLGMDHVKDDGGTFTDTANYSSLIPECTNISAGFNREHTKSEWVDALYVKRLAERLLEVDFTTLTVSRLTTDHEYPDYYTDYYKGWSDGLHQFGSMENVEDMEYFKYCLIRDHPSLAFNILASWGLLDDLVKDMESALL